MGCSCDPPKKAGSVPATWSGRRFRCPPATRQRSSPEAHSSATIAGGRELPDSCTLTDAARRRCVVVGLLAHAAATTAAQTARSQPPGSPAPGDAALFAPYTWRNIGPNRGGRSIAVAGSPSRPNEYYFGATGGGLWKTADGGTTWAPVTDGQIASSSVGAVAIAPSRPDIVYLGMGEAELRGNVMQGDGVYRSDDAGRTWVHRGLAASQAIARIRVHPTDPDLVYVAALGSPFAPNDERGVFRSSDGGRTWSRVLFRSDRAGAVDLVIDPSNPRVL